MTRQHIPLSRTYDPPTSHAAAARAPAFKARHEAKIYSAIADAGQQGATYREVADATGMEPVAVARRLAGMERRGLIQRTYHQTDMRGRPLYISRGGMCVWRKAGAA